MATTNATLHKNVGLKQSPQLISAHIAFSSGLATVTAKELGLRYILGFAGGTWGMTTGLGASVTSTTALPANNGGVTSIDLECIDDASALLTESATVLFWGIG